MYDSDGNGKVSFNDMLEVLRDLSGSFISDVQREVKLFLPFVFLFLSSHAIEKEYVLICIYSPAWFADVGLVYVPC